MMRTTGKAMRDPKMNCKRLDKINRADCIEHIANYVNSSMINDLDKMAGCVNSTLSMITSISTDIEYSSTDVENGITGLVRTNTTICKILMAFYLSGFQLYKRDCTPRDVPFMDLFERVTTRNCMDGVQILSFLRIQTNLTKTCEKSLTT